MVKVPFAYLARYIILPCCLAALLSSCSNTRLLSEGEQLLIDNRIHFQDKNPGIPSDELLSIARPRPNQKFLGLARVKLYFYKLGTHGKPESKFRTWLREKAGERPSVFDSASSLQSIAEMKQYLNKTGYFFSSVEFRTNHLRKKKVVVDYLVTPSVPYRVKSVRYDIHDSIMLSFIEKSIADSRIITGDKYNAFNLDDERDRMTEILQNNGYFYFTRDYIYFEIDSAFRSNELEINVKVKPWMDDTLKGIAQVHKRYFIRNVFITPGFNPMAPVTAKQDTIGLEIPGALRKKYSGDYFLIQEKDDHIHPRTIIQSVFIRPGDPFRQVNIGRTRSRLSEIGVFGYTNIRFKPVTGLPDTITDGILDCQIDLTKRKPHSFTVETEVTNSGGRPGIGLNFTYTNSNIFRGSETFRMKARGALEAQKIFGSNAEYLDGTPFFNTIESGLEMGLLFPRFLIPVRQERFPRYFRPKTTISLGIGYEKRPEFERWLTNLTFGYDWKESERKRHQIFPFDWSLVNVNLSPDFKQVLEDEPNDRIKNQYTDNFITAIRYSYTYNTQDIKKIRDFFFFKGNLETAGNILNLGSNLLRAPVDSLGRYILFGIPFAQYVKIDGDFRFFNVITRNTSFAYRLFLGAGWPYGNARFLPLEKGYYAGGANGMRGWPYRLLGPGSYNNPDDNFDRMGDIQLEANLELRFPIYSFIKSAIFADIGNIWLMKEQESYAGGNFSFSRFYKEFAIDVGLGLRLDFNFFILRVDFATPLRQPAMPAGKRWVANDWHISDVIINFGIGYPF